MGLVSGSKKVRSLDWSPVNKKTYDFGQIMSAASTMTATGVAASWLRDVKIDRKMQDYLIDEYKLDPAFIQNDQYWGIIKRESVIDYLKIMNQERRQNNLPRLSTKDINYMLEAPSWEDFNTRRNQVDRVALANNIISENPVAAFAGATAMSAIEPWNIVSWPVTLAKAASRGHTMMRFAGVGAAITAGEELVLHADDVNRTLGDSLVTIGAASVINSGIGAYVSRTARRELDDLKKIENALRSIDNESRVVINNTDFEPLGTPDTLNLNLIDDVRELNQVLNEIEGVGKAASNHIWDFKTQNGFINALEDLLTDDMSPSLKRSVRKAIESGKISTLQSATDNNIVGAYGLEKLAAISAPLVRLLRSPFPEVKQAAEKLLTNPLLTTNNLKGVPTPTSLEQILDLNRALHNTLIDDLEAGYYSYLFPDNDANLANTSRPARQFRQIGQLGRNAATLNFNQLRKAPFTAEGKMSFDEFKFAVLEHYTGANISEIPSIIKTSTNVKKFFDSRKADVTDFLYSLMKKESDLPKMVSGINYVHRVYNRQKIAENPAGFKQFLIDQLYKKYGSDDEIFKEIGMNIDEMLAGFDISIRKLIATPEERIDLKKVFEPNKRGGALNRFWDFVDDADLYKTNYVIKDLETITNNYVTSVLADVDFHKLYRTLDIDEIVDELRVNIGHRISIIDPDLTKELESNLQLYRDMLRRVRGTYLDVNSPVPGGTMQTMIDNVKKYNSLRFGGLFTVSSFADIGRPVMFLGFKKAYGPIFKAIALQNQDMLKAYSRAARELKVWNIVNDVNYSSLISTLTNLSANSFSQNQLTQILNKSHNSFFTLNLLSLWNQFMKTNSGVAVMSELIEAARLSAAGNLSGKRLQNLAKLGLNETDLKMLLKEFQESGASYDGVYLFNYENWSEAALAKDKSGLSFADRVQLAIKKEVDTIITTPGMGDTPLILENSWVSLITQYKSIMIAAMVRQTLPLLQNGVDKNKLAGLLVAVTGAFVSNQIKAYSRDEEFDDTSWEKHLYDALEGTANLSTIGETAGALDLIFNGNPMLLGPSATIPSDIMKVQNGLSKEDGMNDYERRAAIRMLPYGNLIQFVGGLTGNVIDDITTQYD